MSKARSNDYRLYKFVEDNEIVLYRNRRKVASFSLEDWSYLIANPEVIEPEPEEIEETLVA